MDHREGYIPKGERLRAHAPETMSESDTKMSEEPENLSPQSNDLLSAEQERGDKEKAPILGFCDECGSPVFGGISHLKIAGCVGTTFHNLVNRTISIYVKDNG